LAVSSPVFTDGSRFLTSTGTVSVLHGGTGNTTQTANGVLYATTATSVISDANFTYSNSTKLLTVPTLTVNNANVALTGTNTLMTMTDLGGGGNYIVFGGFGNNIGIENSGAFFMSNNLTYNLTTSSFVYGSAGAALGSYIEWIAGGINLNYASGGSPSTGSTPTTFGTALSTSSTGVVSIPTLVGINSPVFTGASGNLTSTGTVSVAHGGTGNTTQTLNGVLYASTATSVISDANFTYVNNAVGSNNLTITHTTNLETQIILSNTAVGGGIARMSITRGTTSGEASIFFTNNAASVEWVLGVGAGANFGTTLFTLANSASVNVLTATQAGDVTVSIGNLAIATATKGLQQKSVAVTGTGPFTANGAFNTGVVLVAGSKIISNSYVTTSCVGFASVSTTGGTPGTSGYRVVCGTGTYTVTGIATDTSTLNVAFILGN
jgi:hypothetical protein